MRKVSLYPVEKKDDRLQLLRRRIGVDTHKGGGGDLHTIAHRGAAGY